MRVVIIVLGAMLLFSSISLAQIDPDPDGIGLYADLEATQNSAFFDGNPVQEIYLIGTHLSATTAIYGWELSLVFNHPQVFFGGAEYPDGGHVSGDFPFLFGIYQPGAFMPSGTIDVLAIISLLVLTSDPVEIFIGDAPYSAPYYAVAPFGESITLNRSSGSADRPVFRFNGLGPVENEPTSWGELKSLFR